MTIRPGTESDVPAIIELLRLSLGEQLMAKSEEFWRWKHVYNPFGRSDVLLAFEGEKLIGLRVFMKWEWKKEEMIMKAVRAVDTATHPDFQGKGIFRMLTMALVEQCRENRVDFVFNTPNAKSRPGYLKMGWHQAGRLRLQVKPVFLPRAQTSGFLEEHKWAKDWAKNFSFDTPFHKLTTRVSANYLSWRYGANPNVNYQLVLDPSAKPDYAVVFRLKQGGWGNEFRICDAFLSNPGAGHSMRLHLEKAVKQSGASVVSWSSSQVALSSLPAVPVGPIVTLLPLSPISARVNLRSWSPSVGDLEVF